MATADQFCLIILDRPTQAQRDAVHARVKKASKSSWHKYGDVWIVPGGTSPSEWIDRLQPVFRHGPGSVLVLGLPAAGEARSWAYFGQDPAERVAWLHSQYTKDTR